MLVSLSLHSALLRLQVTEGLHDLIATNFRMWLHVKALSPGQLRLGVIRVLLGLKGGLEEGLQIGESCFHYYK